MGSMEGFTIHIIVACTLMTPFGAPVFMAHITDMVFTEAQGSGVIPGA